MKEEGRKVKGEKNKKRKEETRKIRGAEGTRMKVMGREREANKWFLETRPSPGQQLRKVVNFFEFSFEVYIILYRKAASTFARRQRIFVGRLSRALGPASWRSSLGFTPFSFLLHPGC